MSLAEKLQPSDGRSVHSITTPNLDNILRLALNGVGVRTLDRAPNGDVDFGKAASLLDRATNAIAMLTNRRDELEQAAADRERYYNEKIQQLQDQTAEWERRAKVIKAQLQDADTRLTEQQSRIDTLTFRAEQAEARVLIVEQQAADARKQLHQYHDKILDTFGSLV